MSVLDYIIVCILCYIHNAARCRDMVQYPCMWNHTQQILHHITSPLVSVLFLLPLEKKNVVYIHNEPHIVSMG